MPAWRYLTAVELIDRGKQFKIGPVRDRDALEACMLSPAQTFDGTDLYPEIADKAAIVSFNIAKTYHPFVDGNKLEQLRPDHQPGRTGSSDLAGR